MLLRRRRRKWRGRRKTRSRCQKRKRRGWGEYRAWGESQPCWWYQSKRCRRRSVWPHWLFPPPGPKLKGVGQGGQGLRQVLEGDGRGGRGWLYWTGCSPDRAEGIIESTQELEEGLELDDTDLAVVSTCPWNCWPREKRGETWASSGGDLQKKQNTCWDKPSQGIRGIVWNWCIWGW